MMTRWRDRDGTPRLHLFGQLKRAFNNMIATVAAQPV